MVVQSFAARLLQKVTIFSLRLPLALWLRQRNSMRQVYEGVKIKSVTNLLISRRTKRHTPHVDKRV